MTPAVVRWHQGCSHLRGTTSFLTSVSTKMSIRPNNQKLFMWMSHFSYWLEAVMGGWSLRPNAFRKWHFMFSDDFFFPVNHSWKQNSSQTVDYFGYLFHPLENETFPDSWDPSFKMCVCAGTISSHKSQRCNNSQQSKASSLFESLNSEKSFSLQQQWV